MKEITKETAIKLVKTKFWEDMSYEQIARFQLFTDKLCMPFHIFHDAIEKALNRPVYTHEFGLSVDSLKKELLGEKPPPTLEEIVNLIPKEKRIVVEVGND
jgi:hypothetical protein